jgi:secondary thiamine-phosphate synthase enzyme
MTLETQIVRLATQKEVEILDITDKVQTIVENGTIKNGVVFLFVPGSTAALTTIEYEPGLLVDLPSMLERIAPRDGSYEHEKRWHDGNGHSHIRASLIGPVYPCLSKRRS